MDPVQVQNHVSGLDWSERDAFRTGVAEHILRQIGSTATNRDAARAVIANPDLQAKIMSIFENPNDGRRFIDQLNRQSDIFTSGRGMIRAGQEGLRSSAVPTPLARQLAERVYGRGVPESQAGPIAETMGTMATDPQALANMRRLQATADALRQHARTSRIVGGTAAGATAAAMTPSPMQSGQ
jgi:hypothetical protein